MMKRVNSGVLISVLALAASACSSGSSGGSSPATTGPQPSQASAPAANGAPKVAHPFTGATKFVNNPCASLKPSAVLPGARTHKSNSPDGPTCEVDTRPVGFSAGIVANKGISAAYKSKPLDDVFTPYTVDGYPAVSVIQTKSAKGQCVDVVGLTDTSSYVVSVFAVYKGKYMSDPCSLAKAAAANAVETMTGK